MPSHALHKEITKRLYGVKGAKIHKAIDSGYTAYGARHRHHFPHDLLSAAAIGALNDKENPQRGAMIGITHVITDAYFSKRRRRKK